MLNKEFIKKLDDLFIQSSRALDNSYEALQVMEQLLRSRDQETRERAADRCGEMRRIHKDLNDEIKRLKAILQEHGIL